MAFNDQSTTSVSDLKYSYNSMKNDLKDDAINKVTFFLMHPSLGIALGEGAVAYTIGHASRNIQTLTFPADIPQQVRLQWVFWDR